MLLPSFEGFADLDLLHDDYARWRPMAEGLATRHALVGESVRALDAVTVILVLIGSRAVFKLYPPFLRDHYSFECAALRMLAAGIAPPLPIPVPRLLAVGAEQDWPWLLMTQLTGEVLAPHRNGLAKSDKCALLNAIGRLMAALHAQAFGRVRTLMPVAVCQGDWAAFITGQRTACPARQQRTGLPTHLLDQLDGFIAGPVPMLAPEALVLLTGEYTPMNLLIDPQSPSRLSGIFDFGDGLAGARKMDWLGPLVFFAA